MLLAVDIGNTDITFGVFEKKKLIATFRMTSKQQRTSDEFGMFITELLTQNSVQPEEISGVIVASVVPQVMYSLTSAFIKYLKTTPVVVGAGTKTGIKVAVPDPGHVGADLIVDAAAAYEEYGGPVMIVDYGSATTFEIVDKSGAFTACVIAPGIRMSAAALSTGGAKLPDFEIVKPKTILGQDTVTCMQAGIMFGQIGQTEYIIRKMKEEFGSDMKVIATGGLGRIVSDETDVIDVYDPMLTLNGLRIIYDKQKTPKKKSATAKQKDLKNDNGTP